MSMNGTLTTAILPTDSSSRGSLGATLFDRDVSRHSVLIGLSLLFLARVLFIAVCPLELVPDEAYYWDWARQLDWGYYSKPPLIAWVIALATKLGGNSEFAIRVPAACFGTLGLWAIYELTRSLYGSRTAFRAVVMGASIPGLTVMSLLMTIDAPFLCAWSCAVCSVWKMLDSERPDGRWLLPAVVATGLGMLAKQTMLGLFPLTFLFLIASPADRIKLRSPVVWLWVVGSLLFLSPVVWWNSQHDWVTIQHTREHFGGRTLSLLGHVSQSLEFWATQFGILSPAIAAMMLCVVGNLLWKLRVGLGRRELFLVCLGGMPMLGVAGLSLMQLVQPNWPAAFHLTSVVLVAAWSVGQIPLSARIDSLRKHFPSAVACGAVLSVLVALAPVIVSVTPLAGTRLDPTVRLRGWKTLSTEVDHLLSRFPVPQETLIVATTERGPVSELAFYMAQQPRVYLWNTHQQPLSQHDVWGGPTGAEGRDALIVTPQRVGVPSQFAAAFTSVEEQGTIDIPLGPQRTRAFRVWRGIRLKSWPSRIAEGHTAAMPQVLVGPSLADNSAEQTQPQAGTLPAAGDSMTR
jgi:Dolichyl-phosphate-mannose-protein mannosyltransferase